MILACCCMVDDDDDDDAVVLLRSSVMSLAQLFHVSSPLCGCWAILQDPCSTAAPDAAAVVAAVVVVVSSPSARVNTFIIL